MADPVSSSLITTYLSIDTVRKWAPKLWTRLAAMNETKREELKDVVSTFGDPRRLEGKYIFPDIQLVNPADLDGPQADYDTRTPAFDYIGRFVAGTPSTQAGNNQLFLLAGAGMGKTSLLLMLKLFELANYLPKNITYKLLKLGTTTLDDVTALSGQEANTVLLLDSLDEDLAGFGRIEERLTELLQATRNFRQVILTCRTQFFPRGSSMSIERTGRIVIGGFTCSMRYLSPFSDEQVQDYLRRAFPTRRFKETFLEWLGVAEGNAERTKAMEVVRLTQTARCRPLVLSYVEDLLGLEQDDLDNECCVAPRQHLPVA